MPASPQRRTRRVAPADAPAASQLRRVQAATTDARVRLPEDVRAVEVADSELAVPIAGKGFRLAASIGLMPLMEWAASSDGVDTTSTAQLVTFYHLLKNVVHPEDWQDFCAHTREHKCTDEEFVAFQNAAMEAIAARPTRGREAS